MPVVPSIGSPRVLVTKHRACRPLRWHNTNVGTSRGKQGHGRARRPQHCTPPSNRRRCICGTTRGGQQAYRWVVHAVTYGVLPPRGDQRHQVRRSGCLLVQLLSPASRSWAKLPARNCSPILKWQPGWPTSRNILTQRNWSISVEMQRRNRLAAVGRCVFAHLPLRLDVPLGSESSQRVS